MCVTFKCPHLRSHMNRKEAGSITGDLILSVFATLATFITGVLWLVNLGTIVEWDASGGEMTVTIFFRFLAIVLWPILYFL